jgi:hypothetical protein
MEDYSGYKWIEVKHHKVDPNKSWEENYKDLEKHHVEETTFLIEKVRELAREKETLGKLLDELRRQG